MLIIKNKLTLRRWDFPLRSINKKLLYTFINPQNFFIMELGWIMALIGGLLALILGLLSVFGIWPFGQQEVR